MSTAPGATTGQEGKRLARASFRTGIGTIASRVTGLLRLVVAAYALGAQPTGDAFNLANSTPNIVHDLVLGGVLTASFLPVFVDRLATRPRREADRSISAVVSMSLVVLLVASLLLIALAPEIVDLYTIGSANHPAERALAVKLLRYFAPQVLAYGLISLIGAVLATKDRFVAVGVAPVVNNVVGIAILAVFASVAKSSEVGSGNLTSSHIALLGLGTTAAVVLQALALVPSLLRCGVRLRMIWRPHDPAIAAIARLSSWTLGFVGANQLAVFAILALEYRLRGVTEYSYAYQFFLFPYAVVAVSVVNVVTPTLARAHVAGDRAALGRSFGNAGRQVLALVLPAAVGYLVLAKPVITLVLAHGAFNKANDVSETAATLALFALGLPAFCLWVLAIRTFQAMHDTRTAFFCYLVENATNIALAFVLYRPLGVKGLALAYTAAYVVGATMAIVILRTRLGTIGGRAIVVSCVRAILLSLLMAVAVAFTSAVIGSGTGLFGWIRLFISIAVGGVAYIGGAGVAASMFGWQTSRRPRR